MLHPASPDRPVEERSVLHEAAGQDFEAEVVVLVRAQREAAPDVPIPLRRLAALGRDVEADRAIGVQAQRQIFHHVEPV